MIWSQIRRCRRLIPEAAALVLGAHDYESKAKPSCDWPDAESRSGLVNALVADGRAAIAASGAWNWTKTRRTRWACWQW